MAGAKPGVHVVQLKRIEVAENLIKGNKFIKWDESSTTGIPVTLKVDPNGHILYWKDQNKEIDCLDISFIRDTRTGRYARVPKEGKLRDSCNIGNADIPLEDKTVSVCHGTDMVNIDWTHFVCTSKDTATEWATELLCYSTNVLADNSSVMDFLEKAHTKLTTMVSHDGRVPVKNIIRMVATSKDDRRRVEKALEAVNLPSGKTDTIDLNKFSFDAFFAFYCHLLRRTEVDQIFADIGAKKKPYLGVDQLVTFLNQEQRDPRLNEILYPFTNQGQAMDLIKNLETKTGMAAKGHMSQEAFLRYLLSEENNLIPAEKLDLSEDMTAPLAHYFINSSHNTYLTGHQFTGKSSVEIYRQVLISGCRCIELDCWDSKGNDEEPIITHGFTMCTDILFKDVIEAIAESAFKTSDYPVILSFENHCSPKFQAKMAAHCRNIFGEMLLTDPLESFALKPSVPLPSPEALKRKIIIKNKKKHFHREPIVMGHHRNVGKHVSTKSSLENKSSGKSEASVVSNAEVTDGETAAGDEENSDSGSDSDSDSDDDDIAGLTEEEERRRQRDRTEKGTARSEAEAAMEMSALVNYIQPVHFHSFEVSEKRLRSYEISSFVESQALSLLKEYPVDFVNYNKRQLSRIYPRGTRVDSSNYIPQMFWNAGCQLAALNFQTLDLGMQLNLGIFEYNGGSGYILKPDFMRRKDRHFDPFAESTVDGIIANTVSMRIISGQLLSDKKVGTYVEVDMYGLPADTVRRRFKTKVVTGNSMNPVYGEEPFVFKKVVLPNLAVIRIAVYEEQGKLLGHRILPVEGLRPGYRHVSLRNECNQPLGLSTLFVHVSVKDYVSDAFAEFAEALANPQEYVSQLDRHTQQLAVLTEGFEDKEDENGEVLESIDTKRQIRQNSLPSHRNGSFHSVSNSDHNNGTPSKSMRMHSNSHMSLNTQDSNFSKTSSDTGSGSGIHSISRMPSSNYCLENGSVTSLTKLNDPELIKATPLSELKLLKAHMKIIHKRDKEIESLKRKSERVREGTKEFHHLQEEKVLMTQMKAEAALEKTHGKGKKKAVKAGNLEEVTTAQQQAVKGQLAQHKEQHASLCKSQCEVYIALCKDQYKAELDVCLRYHEPLHTTLGELIEQANTAGKQNLEDIHDQDVHDFKKRLEAQSRVEMKTLAKKHRDKQELSRIKREQQQKQIQLAVQERQKLKGILEKRQEELQESFDVIKKEFAEDKEAVFKKFHADFEQNCQQITEEINKNLPATSGKDGAGKGLSTASGKDGAKSLLATANKDRLNSEDEQTNF